MMSRSRYEQVPQADQEIIELHNDPTYNYNSAIPNSPPPSFHSSQSTPAVSIAGVDFDIEHDRAFNNTTPRPIPSIIGGGSGAAGGSASSAADVAMIANLHRRVERLEETIGRLLLEKPELDSSSFPSGGSGARDSSGRSNCCVTFPSPSELSAAERAELLSASSSCCVRFGRAGRRGRRDDETDEERAQRRERRSQWLITLAVVGFIFAILGWYTLLVWLKHRPQQQQVVVGCEACFPAAGTVAGSGGGWSAAGQNGEDASWSSSGR